MSRQGMVGVVYVAYSLPPIAQLSQGKLQSLYSVNRIQEVISLNRTSRSLHSKLDRIAPTQPSLLDSIVNPTPQTMIDRNTFPT